MDDGTLLEQWSCGDRDAGSLLFERHFRSLHRFFGNKLSSLHDVEDLVQQTLMACVTARESFRRDASFRTFLFAIARNILFKHLRERRSTDELDADGVSIADCGMGPSTAVRVKGEQRLLLQALRHIPIDSQVVLEMYYWEPMQAKEIADVLDETVPAVRGRLRRAKAQLLEALDRLASDRDERNSTVERLEDWAKSLRGYWGG